MSIHYIISLVLYIKKAETLKVYVLVICTYRRYMSSLSSKFWPDLYKRDTGFCLIYYISTKFNFYKETNKLEQISKLKAHMQKLKAIISKSSGCSDRVG